jgi:hypothetical protein
VKEIDKLPLHDATLESIKVDWGSREVAINLKVYTSRNSSVEPYVLKFEKVNNIQAPHDSPWGDSESINRVTVEDKKIKIEIQSGDVIEVSAEIFGFDPRSS